MTQNHESRRKEEQAYLEWVGECLSRQMSSVSDMASTAGDVGTFRAMRRPVEALQEQLGNIEQPFYGRIDFVDDGDDDMPSTFYIGRAPIRGETISENAVVDWRSPVGELFNQANRHEPMGVGRRVNISNANWLVSKVSDEVLTRGFTPPLPTTAEVPLPPGVDPEQWVVDLTGDRPKVEETPQATIGRADSEAPAYVELPIIDDSVGSGTSPGLDVDVVAELDEAGHSIRGMDVLFDELVRDRTGKMEEVVATIQGDQDRILRSDPFRALAIQGGPGTGKTVVALHRAAWVIYRLGELSGVSQAPRVLVVGPNDRYIDYISDVLPSLGEATVQHYSLHRLALSALNAADRPTLPPQGRDSAIAARIKGDPRMHHLLKLAVWLDTQPSTVSAPYGRYVLRVSIESVQELIERIFEAGVPYRGAQHALRSGLVDLLIEGLHRREAGFSLSATARDSLARDLARHLNESGQIVAMFPDVTPRDIVRRIYFDPSFRHRCNDLFSADELAALQPKKGTPRSYKWTSADLALLDEAAALIRGVDDIYAHVVVDEAQDLSPMQWRMVSRRFRGSSVTITGDLAQATKRWCPASWDEVASWSGRSGQFDVVNLGLGYRVPTEIMEYAARLLPIAAPGLASPISVRSSEEPTEIRVPRSEAVDQVLEIAVDWIGRDGLTAVVASPTRVVELENRLDELGFSASDVTVVPSTEAKGLEFDRVVVLDPDEIVGDDGDLGLRRLYIALTRSTRSLAVIGEMSVFDRVEREVARRSGATAEAPDGSRRGELFDHDLAALIRSAFAAPCEFVTVANQATNRITAIEPEGMWIETGASIKKGSGPQLVPAWMFNEAWRILQRNGELTQQDLLNGLHGRAVKRSAAVVGVLARLHGVEVLSVRPTKVGKTCQK